MQEKEAKCQKCGGNAKMYSMKVKTTGIKGSALFLVLLLIIAIWAMIFWYAGQPAYGSSGAFTALFFVGIVGTIVAVLLTRVWAGPKQARVVRCDTCYATYVVDAPPKHSKGWDTAHASKQLTKMGK